GFSGLRSSALIHVSVTCSRSLELLIHRISGHSRSTASRIDTTRPPLQDSLDYRSSSGCVERTPLHFFEPAGVPEETSFSIGNSSMLHPEAPQFNNPRRTIFTDDTSGNLTGKSFSRSCSPAARRLSSPSTNSARSGRGELSNTRLNRADTGLLVIAPSFTVRACTSSNGACTIS